MISRHPAENFIKFLLSRCLHTYAEIKGMCELRNLGNINLDYLRYLDIELRRDRPVPFRGHDPTHRASVAYLRRHDIAEAWHPTTWMRGATDLLGNAVLRSYLETYILAPMKREQSLKKIESITGVKIPTRTFDLFRHYYWNPSNLTAAEWGEFNEKRDVVHREWLQLAVTAKGAEGVRLLLWKTGTASSLRHIDGGKMFTHLRNIAYFKALEIEHAPAGLRHSETFRNYVQSAKMAQEEVASSAAAMTDVLDSFKSFHMQTDDSQIPKLSDIGDFSDSVDNIVAEEKIGMDDY
jgi:hypothetical protein